MKIEMNFSDAEIEVLISEVHSKRNILFSSVAYILEYQVLKKGSLEAHYRCC